MNGKDEGSANYNMVCEERDQLQRQLSESREYAQTLRIEIEKLKLDLQVIYQKRNNVEMERDALSAEMGKAQSEYLLKTQQYGVRIYDLTNALSRCQYELSQLARPHDDAANRAILEALEILRQEP